MHLLLLTRVALGFGRFLLLAVFAMISAVAGADEVPGGVLLEQNGGWCWFQNPRAIVLKNGNVVFTTISGDS